jgi:hypothetical protein
METYKLDRIYSWLSLALGYNNKADKKYFYDEEEKLFFNLGFKEGQYFVWTNQIPLSNTNRRIVESKMPNIISGDKEIIEIIATSDKFRNMFQERPKSAEDFEELIKKEKELYQEIESFLQRNNINVHDTTLIE